MLSLSKLCEIELVRNYRLLEDVSNVPYRLISNALKLMKVDQIRRLEAANVLLIFDDDELWENFVKQEFPLRVSDLYTSRRDIIQTYYLSFVKKNDPELFNNDRELIDNLLNSSIKKCHLNNKFRLPYRLLYLRYEEDDIRKAKQSTERLRLQMRKIKEERESKQSVKVDHLFYSHNNNIGTKRKAKLQNDRSDLFKKSLKQHQTRLKKFKDGGFDIAKGHAKRVAFGGVAGGYHQRPLANDRNNNNNNNNNDDDDNDIEIDIEIDIDNNNSKLEAKSKNLSTNETTIKNGCEQELINKDNEKDLTKNAIIPQKRRSGITNIFLTKKKPNLSPSPTKKLNDTVKASSSIPIIKNGIKSTGSSDPKIGKKKESGIFSKNRFMSTLPKTKNTKKIYIHDKKK
ncbi:hypothetical protein Kpol_529p23 [Vanderwaltozyma polyspora DSM 70294]|uniref:Elongin-A n=1 Tax=Vanderwaltozyma polyspora (strain ATCC 22028 / DSM 70294 / BCRC 21397 / CBS 2163 / NBRC 10782 / NRRL Y-8283 / UCD 57-17) TaxID=436907 RepID=A7TM76_VANPO|nr:uncharacterized protein Kpol_529p23 [Vanderwaltozyma polyspora DSM 70294]EDO16643.1 hypothetical protein Kpol_529p23 [Vanderwaltozyma polyspora DSM 70294]